MTKIKRFKPVLFSLIVVLGILISLMVKVTTTGQKYVRIQDLYLLKDEIKSDIGAVEQYKKTISQKQAYLNKYNEDEAVRSKIIKKTLIAEREKYKALSGSLDLIGEGLVIIVSDSDREISEIEDENDLVVHDVNIRRIVDDLFAAGAEAISVNDNRILMNRRDIICNGPSIRVNNSILSHPFVIKAIGNKDYLKAAINAPGKYGTVLKELGIYLEVIPSMNVEVKAYSGYKWFDKLSGEKE